jgi:hypothetical protein
MPDWIIFLLREIERACASGDMSKGRSNNPPYSDLTLGPKAVDRSTGVTLLSVQKC